LGALAGSRRSLRTDGVTSRVERLVPAQVRRGKALDEVSAAIPATQSPERGIKRRHQ